MSLGFSVLGRRASVVQYLGILGAKPSGLGFRVQGLSLEFWGELLQNPVVVEVVRNPLELPCFGLPSACM